MNFRTTAAILLLALAVSGLGQAGTTLRLKEKSFVRGPAVLLGDIAEIEGDNAQALAGVEVISAALPGSSRNVHAGLIESRLRQAGYSPENVSIEGPDSVMAATLYMEIEAEVIAESLRTFIESEMPWDAAQAEIDVPPPRENVTAPEGVLEIRWRCSPQYRYIGSGVFRGRICVDGREYKTIMCRAEVEAWAEVLVAASDIPRGRPLAGAAIEKRTMAMSRIPVNAIWDKEALRDQIARKTIFPGEVLKGSSVTARTVVKRNQLVPVEMKSNGLQVQSQARAMSDGRAGEVIVCMNPRSEQQFHGVVRRDGVVEVR
jgi:flagellar basal body P-ring formation protein FlgA